MNRNQYIKTSFLPCDEVFLYIATFTSFSNIQSFKCFTSYHVMEITWLFTRWRNEMHHTMKKKFQFITSIILDNVELINDSFQGSEWFQLSSISCVLIYVIFLFSPIQWKFFSFSISWTLFHHFLFLNC